MNDSFFGRVKYKIYAVILLAIIALFVGVCVAGYNKAFISTVPIQLHAERIGLQMYPGNRVLLRGVDVGKVGEFKPASDGNGVDITLDMNPALISKVPAHARVSLDQLTAFGAKTVTLAVPPGERGPSLQPGGTLAAGRVTVEVNSVFEQLTRVLTDAQPAKVNAVLGGLAQALDGRGEKIGQTVDQLDGYLRRFNTDIPTLRADFEKGAQVADIYADATPDLLKILKNGTVTSNTLVDKQGELDRMLFQVKRVSGIGEDFLLENGDDIVDLNRNLLPTTSLLARYSPEFKCFLEGLDVANKRLSQAMANGVPGVNGLLTVNPGTQDYKYPDNRPVIGSNNGPDCVGLPNVDGNTIQPGIMKNVDKGGESNPSPGDNTERPGNIVAQLFGGSAVSPRNGSAEQTAQQKTQERENQGRGQESSEGGGR